MSVSDLPKELSLIETVFWEPLDTESLRKMLQTHPELVAGKTVLEIGTGSGLLALCCVQAGAQFVVATDINPQAIRCARANARRQGLAARIEFRLVPSSPGSDSTAYAVARADEKFDVIISNPPWEDDKPVVWSDFALYDPGFDLLRSLLSGFREHTTDDARLLLAYGCVAAIQAAERLASEFQLEMIVLDDRDPDGLPAVFLPGITLGIARSLSPPGP